MQQDKKIEVRGLFMSSGVSQGGALTTVHLCLLPQHYQDPALESMLQHCDIKGLLLFFFEKNSPLFLQVKMEV
jgi:hypothetical protein